MSKFRDYLFLFLTAGFVVALDQYSKWLVRSQLDYGEMWLPASLKGLLPYMRIVYWHNSGAAFGLFQRGNLILAILAFIVIGVIIYYYPRVSPEDWWLKLAMGLQLGGAMGNLIDRLRLWVKSPILFRWERFQSGMSRIRRLLSAHVSYYWASISRNGK